jgi:predicted transposase YbfD/YdcC
MDELPLSESHRNSLQQIRERFACLHDKRQPGKVRHALNDVLMSALCAMICGCEDFSSMAAFAKHRLDWLREFLPLENGAPAHDTFRNIFLMIRPDDFAAILPEWFGGLSGEHIAVDGKAIRSSYDPDKRKCTLHLVRAWIDERSLCVARVACEEKSNEIEAIPRLLDSLDLQGATVTIDAAGCQTAIAEQIEEAGGSYILALKGNQGEAHEVVKAHFERLSRPCDAMSEESGHGRYEKRECWVEDDLSFFHKSWKWHGLTRVVQIRRETCRRESRGTDGLEANVEDQYYLCSSAADAENILATVRKHWGIENRCHWTLDVVFGEDDHPVRDRNAMQNLSTLRDLSIHLLRAHPSKQSLPKKRLQAILDPNFRTEIIRNLHA